MFGNGEAVQGHLLSLAAFAGTSTVALYAARADEVPLDRVAEVLVARGATLVFPRVDGDRLLFLRAGAAELSPGYRGILEPPPSAPRVAVEAIDVFVVPGLLFDRAGRRLGRGSGFYDRALAHARADALRIGLCYAESVVDELPREDLDVDMHLIVSDGGVLPVSGAEPS